MWIAIWIRQGQTWMGIAARVPHLSPYQQRLLLLLLLLLPIRFPIITTLYTHTPHYTPPIHTPHKLDPGAPQPLTLAVFVHIHSTKRHSTTKQASKQAARLDDTRRRNATVFKFSSFLCFRLLLLVASLLLFYFLNFGLGGDTGSGWEEID
ncbi:uncharacterized protein K452DRAFT_43144 [Aplosporella prunicola CBS 121167]|uniref:Uncharacterized protein n=1 Tax=Aplosporella prunicola CBS 121167 TaxID=1176127 RepID=A0A6A6BCI0_9PEZI|nr:uncharacterized protein K452DRAFT_43144 [Aplosporella prunicola CBS 121167]KAF2140944.1 hypothetical protein K452DRAFT_43144 [Aplosporella prunicola CBS 121167]